MYTYGQGSVIVIDSGGEEYFMTLEGHKWYGNWLVIKGKNPKTPKTKQNNIPLLELLIYYMISDHTFHLTYIFYIHVHNYYIDIFS